MNALLRDQTSKESLKRRTFVAAALSSCCLSACGKQYPYFFDIEWDEEVLLHDGRIIWVHMKRTYERLDLSSEWNGIFRDTEISFDAGDHLGRIKKSFRRYDVGFIHHKNANWYLALGVTTGTPPVNLVSRESPFLVINKYGAVSNVGWKELPLDFKTRNLMPDTPDSAGIAKFHRKRLSQVEKIDHWKAFPRAAGDAPEGNDTPALVRP